MCENKNFIRFTPLVILSMILSGCLSDFTGSRKIRTGIETDYLQDSGVQYNGWYVGYTRNTHNSSYCLNENSFNQWQEISEKFPGSLVRITFHDRLSGENKGMTFNGGCQVEAAQVLFVDDLCVPQVAAVQFAASLGMETTDESGFIGNEALDSFLDKNKSLICKND